MQQVGARTFRAFLDEPLSQSDYETVFANGVRMWLVKGNIYHRVSCVIDKLNSTLDSILMTWEEAGTTKPLESYTAALVLGKPVLSAPGIGSTNEEDYPDSNEEWLEGIAPPEQKTAEQLVMGINGTGVSVADGLIRPRGLTITELGRQDLPRVFLGDLSRLDASKSGYGLYSDNVYLNGSLTTEVGKNSYAGVNTLNGSRAQVFGTGFNGFREVPSEIDSSRIVFWAGAESTSESDI